MQKLFSLGARAIFRKILMGFEFVEGFGRVLLGVEFLLVYTFSSCTVFLVLFTGSFVAIQFFFQFLPPYVVSGVWL